MSCAMVQSYNTVKQRCSGAVCIDRPLPVSAPLVPPLALDIYPSLSFSPALSFRYPFGNSLVSNPITPLPVFLAVRACVCVRARAAEQIWIGSSELIATCHPVLSTLPSVVRTNINTLTHTCNPNISFMLKLQAVAPSVCQLKYSVFGAAWDGSAVSY